MTTAYTACTFKKDRIALLRANLASNASWATRGCQCIFGYQTADEQSIGVTVEDNGVGFTGADSTILSSFAKQINAGRFVGSKKQMDILFKKMPKYAKQLDNVAQAKQKQTP